MNWKTLAFLATLALAAAPGAQAACDPTDRIDGSTIETARKKIEAAGYRQIKDLSKGCDNFWRGAALKDGKAVNVVLTPQGQVMIDGN